MNISEASTKLEQSLAPDITSPKIEAKRILAKILGCSLEKAYSYADSLELTSAQKKYLAAILEELANNKPVPYITGETEFFSYKIHVTEDVLLPRPETEGLVELALQNLPNKAENETLTILEIGAGSGCITTALCCELAKRRIRFHYTGIDISAAAAQVATENVTRELSKLVAPKDVLQLVSILCATLPTLSDLPCFDVIISNPPYVTATEYKELDQSVKGHEPKQALLGGQDGLNVYREISDYLRKTISSHTAKECNLPLVLLEISPTIAASTKSLFSYYPKAKITEDVFGRTRYFFGHA